MDESNKILSKASLFKISRQAAANMRIRYLQGMVHALLDATKEPPGDIALYWANQAMDEIVGVVKKMNDPKKVNSGGGISDSDIDAARQVRADVVIEFKNGTAHAWCHEDRKPSLYFASRLGIAICPVCDRKFSALDVLIDRDGIPFVDAVKALR